MKVVALPILVFIALTASISWHREPLSTDALWREENTNLPNPGKGAGVEVYCWPLSAAPGGTIEFYASGVGSSHVRFWRHKANQSGVTSIPMETTTVVLVEQTTNSKPWRNGAGWRPSFSQRIPADWPSGIYSAEIKDPAANSAAITFIVKPLKRRSSLAVLANVNTWLAYNDWGGRYKYDGETLVSFMRPNHLASPTEAGFAGGHLTRAELWILSWLEDEGYQPDVYTDLDYHNGIPGGYTHLVLSTHPEYWTLRMQDNLKAFLDGGGSLLYLGGNGMFEEGEYTSDQRGMIFFGGREGNHREDALFRRLRPPRPERAILGVATERCAVRGAPYVVLQECHPLFRGTGLSNGDTFGEDGVNTRCGGDCGDPKRINGGASGWEVDTSAGPGATGIPSNCSVPSARVASSVLPRGLTILAKGQDGGAEMVYYQHPGGGAVFSVGSITFGGSLVVDRKIQQIVRNVLTPNPARITRAVRLGEGEFPWRLISTSLTGERLYRINLTRRTLSERCSVEWYKITTLPPYFHDLEGRDACNPQISIGFPSGIRITRVAETADGAYRDLESFPASPVLIRQIFFSDFGNLVFRAERSAPKSTYKLPFEFLAPSERLCRIPGRP
jgi:hypothetical protein